MVAVGFPVVDHAAGRPDRRGTRSKIVMTTPLPEPLIAELGAEHTVVLAPGEEELLREVATADALIGGFGGGDGGRFQRLVAGARRLKWIHTSSAGIDRCSARSSNAAGRPSPAPRARWSGACWPSTRSA